MPTFPPIHHVALTVSNLDKSTAWYNRVFETEPALEMSLDNLDRRVYLLPGGQLLGITRHKNADAAGVFDPTTAGLDHVGFGCDDRAEIDGWAAYLTDHGVAHKGVQDTPYGQVLSFKDPDGNAFDFFLGKS
jgi:glyoxylase I family protein